MPNLKALNGAALNAVPAVTGVTITPAGPTSVTAGATVALAVTVAGTNNPPQRALWSTSDGAVATVDPASGLVSGVAAGTVTITATDREGGAFSDTRSITVAAGTPSVTIAPTPNPFTLAPGATQVMNPHVVAVNGATSGVNWSSSNPAIATVDSGGTVTAVTAGSATITATSTWDGVTTGSASLTVSATISITQQPTGAKSNTTFSPVVTVSLSGAPDGTLVTATIASGTGAVGGTATRGTVSGVATFTGLTIVGLGAHTIQFASPGYTSVTSSSVTMTGYVGAGTNVLSNVTISTSALGSVTARKGIFAPTTAVPGVKQPCVVWCTASNTGDNDVSFQNDGFLAQSQWNPDGTPALVFCVMQPFITPAADYYKIDTWRQCWVNRLAQEWATFVAAYDVDLTRVHYAGYSKGGQAMWMLIVAAIRGLVSMPIPASILAGSSRADVLQLVRLAGATRTKALTYVVDDQNVTPKTVTCSVDVASADWFSGPDIVDLSLYANLNDAQVACNVVLDALVGDIPTMLVCGDNDQNWDGKGVDGGYTVPTFTTTNCYPGIVKGGKSPNGANTNGYVGPNGLGQAEQLTADRGATWYGVDGSKNPVTTSSNSPRAANGGAAVIDYTKHAFSPTDRRIVDIWKNFGHGTNGTLWPGPAADVGYGPLTYTMYVAIGSAWQSNAGWVWMMAQTLAVTSGVTPAALGGGSVSVYGSGSGNPFAHMHVTRAAPGRR